MVTDLDASMAAQVEPVCRALRDEPLFHLSLHSKELFHSNLLAWFAERYLDEAVELFALLEVPRRVGSGGAVRREHRNLDLIVPLPGLAPVVIENKVFSLPDDRQLVDYSAAGFAGFKDPTLILLSLIPPSWPDRCLPTAHGTWRWVGYGELADALAPVARKLAESHDPIRRFAGDLLVHYVEMVRQLCQLVKLVGSPGSDDPVDFGEATKRELRDARVHDGLGKLRARLIEHRLRTEVGVEVGGHEIKWDSGFTRGGPLLEGFVLLSNGDQVGWQYQQGQWRLAVVTGVAGGSASQHAYVADRYRRYFDFAPLAEILGEVGAVSKAEVANDFNRFDPGFVYRYRKVPGLRVSQMCRLAKEYLELAAQLD